MKRSDVLQLGVILVGIIMGLLALQSVFSSLYGVFVLITGGRYGSEYMYATVLTFFAVTGLQALACFLLITRSRNIAEWIYRRSGLSNGFKITSKPNDLLFIVLICIGIFLLISNISPLLSAIFINFKRVGGHNNLQYMQESNQVKWIELILEVLLPLILLMAARPIADYFARNINDEPIIIEEEGEPNLLINGHEEQL